MASESSHASSAQTHTTHEQSGVNTTILISTDPFSTGKRCVTGFIYVCVLIPLLIGSSFLLQILHPVFCIRILVWVPWGTTIIIAWRKGGKGGER